MARTVPYNLPAKSLTNHLVSKADSQHGNGRVQMFHQFQTNPCFIGGAGSRRYHDSAGAARLDLRDGPFVVPEDLNLASQLPEISGKVVGKAVVIVDEQNHGTVLTEYLPPVNSHLSDWQLSLPCVSL